MKRIIPFFLILPFLVVACGDELFQVSFDYTFESSFQLDAFEEAGTYSINSEAFDLSVLEELDERGLAALEAAELSQISLNIADDFETSWGFATEMALYAVLDGEAFLIAEAHDIPAEAGQEVTLTPAADEFRMLSLLERRTATARLDISTRSGIDETIKIGAETDVRITASPE